MKKIVDLDKCCGCHACINICSNNAITMQEDKKGFKYPTIDQNKCINCELCKKVCPILNNEKEKEKEILSYAAYNKNIEEREASSSGGIFILLAKEIIQRNGVVFGASFDENFNVVHSYVENEIDLQKFMGSKYTQSSINYSYKKVKEFLDNDRYVLFSGTPCQIEGLKSFLRKDYDKLYTQDLICHGVPSPKAWKKYLDWQRKESDDKIKSIQFRNKDLGWTKFQMKITFKTKTYSNDLSKDIYLQAFLKNICLRNSCYNCSFKKKYRISDITLADFWGITNCHPEMNDDKGTSLILINSNKGKELFNNINDKIFYIETDLLKATKYNSAYTSSVKHCSNEKKFADNIDKMEFDNLCNKYVPKKTSLINKIVIKIKVLLKKVINKLILK